MRKKRWIEVGAVLLFLSLLALFLTDTELRRSFYYPAMPIEQRKVNSWGDTVIWKAPDFPERLYIVPDQPEVGYITYVNSELYFVKGNEKEVFWTYEDYSNLRKVTLSKDRTIIRAFVTWTVFNSEELIFEYNTKTKETRKYSIQKD